jgi:peptidoglycan/LPS O-acetylase OafA/YrhL
MIKINRNRNKNLDGLRGLASLVVVAHHLLLTLPWVDSRSGFQTHSLKGEFKFSFANLVEYSPFHLLYAGSEAVIVFFVLSGYVLVFAVSRENTSHYLKNRMLRLYLPIVGCILVATLFAKLRSYRGNTGYSHWVTGQSFHLHLRDVVQNMWVLDGTTSLNSSLWSMRYEIVFSMLILVITSVKFQKRIQNLMISLICLNLIMYIGLRLQLDLLQWMPIFFIGSSLHFLKIQDKYSGIRMILGLLLLLFPWYLAGYGYHSSLLFQRIVATAGAFLIIDASRTKNLYITKVLSSSISSFLGKISYSLYLVHVPIILCGCSYFSPPTNISTFLLHCIILLPIIFIVAVTCNRLFENPVLHYIHKNS